MATGVMHVQLVFIPVHMNQASLKSDHKKLRNSALNVKNCKFSCRCLAAVVAMVTGLMHVQLDFILVHMN